MASSRSNQLPNNNIQRIVTAPPERFLPRAKLILEAESVQIPEDKLLGALQAVYANEDDNRAYYRALDTLIYKSRQRPRHAPCSA